VNKGVVIGVAVGIVAVIAGAYAFFGISEDRPPDQSAMVGMEDEVEVKPVPPTEAEQEEVETPPTEAEQEEPQGEKDELGMKEEAEVEVVPPTREVSAEESMGATDEN